MLLVDAPRRNLEPELRIARQRRAAPEETRLAGQHKRIVEVARQLQDVERVVRFTPRRRNLLRQGLGVDFEVIHLDAALNCPAADLQRIQKRATGEILRYDHVADLENSRLSVPRQREVVGRVALPVKVVLVLRLVGVRAHRQLVRVRMTGRRVADAPLRREAALEVARGIPIVREVRHRAFRYGRHRRIEAIRRSVAVGVCIGHAAATRARGGLHRIVRTIVPAIGLAVAVAVRVSHAAATGARCLLVRVVRATVAWVDHAVRVAVGLAFIGHAVRIAISAGPTAHVQRIRRAIAVAVHRLRLRHFLAIGRPVGVRIDIRHAATARARRGLRRVRRTVITRIDHAVPVVVELALVRNPVGVAIRAGAGAQVKIIRHTVVVAVPFTLVRHAVRICVHARRRAEIAEIRHAVPVAVRHSTVGDALLIGDAVTVTVGRRFGIVRVGAVLMLGGLEQLL